MVCREASMACLRGHIAKREATPVVGDAHFDAALRAVQPRIPADMVEFFEQFQASAVRHNPPLNTKGNDPSAVPTPPTADPTRAIKPPPAAAAAAPAAASAIQC